LQIQNAHDTIMLIIYFKNKQIDYIYLLPHKNIVNSVSI